MAHWSSAWNGIWSPGQLHQQPWQWALLTCLWRETTRGCIGFFSNSSDFSNDMKNIEKLEMKSIHQQWSWSFFPAIYPAEPGPIPLEWSWFARLEFLTCPAGKGDHFGKKHARNGFVNGVKSRNYSFHMFSWGTSVVNDFLSSGFWVSAVSLKFLDKRKWWTCQTCPWRIKTSNIVRWRCRIRHADAEAEAEDHFAPSTFNRMSTTQSRSDPIFGSFWVSYRLWYL